MGAVEPERDLLTATKNHGDLIRVERNRADVAGRGRYRSDVGHQDFEGSAIEMRTHLLSEVYIGLPRLLTLCQRRLNRLQEGVIGGERRRPRLLARERGQHHPSDEPREHKDSKNQTREHPEHQR